MYAFKKIEDDQGLVITTRKDKARHAAKVAGMRAARAARDANALALAAAAVAQAIANINNANADATNNNNANANVGQANANQVATGSNVPTMTAGPSVGNTNTNTNTNAAAAYNPGPVRPTHQHVNQGNTPAPLKRSPRIYNIACYREVEASSLRDHEKKRWFYWLKFHENAMYIARLNGEDIKPLWNTYEDVEDDDE